jgi:sporulation protein YlmC with PRC-barrel domain
MLKLTGVSFLAVAFALPVLARTPATQPGPVIAAPTIQNTPGTGLAPPSAGNTMLTGSGDLRASQIIGSPVYNDKNEKVGSIRDLVIGTGNSLLAIIEVGGVLGIGAKTVAVPFNKLELSLANGNLGDHLVLPGATKDGLAAMPDYRYAAR